VGALFLLVFIAWQGSTIYADRFDTDNVLFRGVMLTAMLAIAALAVQIPDVTHGRSAGVTVAYVVLRSLMVGLYVRAYRHVPEARPLIVRYGTGTRSGGVLAAHGEHRPQGRDDGPRLGNKTFFFFFFLLLSNSMYRGARTLGRSGRGSE
jgi:low temperature requirement protein LtrA